MSFAVTALLLAMLALLEQPPQPAFLQENGVVQPEVWGALETENDVAVIVNLSDPPPNPVGADIDALMASTAQQQASVLDDLTAAEFTLSYQYDVVPALAGRITYAGATKLDEHPDVAAVWLDPPIYPALGQSVPLIRANDERLSSLELDGSAAVIAVIDSGIDTDHPDLDDNIVGQACFLDALQLGVCPDDPEHPLFDPADPQPAEDDWVNFGYHGTHVSGIITSRGVQASAGVAPASGIFAYKVFNYLGQGHFGDVLAALEDALFQNQSGAVRIDFINMSLGDGQSYEPGNCPVDENQVYANIDFVLGFLREEQGVLTFASAGNSGSKSGLTWPACDPWVVSVGATYDADVGSADWYDGGVFICTDETSEPDQATCFSQASAELDVLAPGAKILSTSAFPELEFEMSGTSMASPHAAGVAALLKQALPNITPDEIVEILQDTGVPVTDDFDPANVRTTPRVDAAAAVLEDDYDEDGCDNGSELQDEPGSQFAGGLRDPEYRWDYYDTNLDGQIDLPNDILGVILRWTPNPALSYDEVFDRGPTVAGAEYHWVRHPADDVIDLPNDIVGVILQWTHNC